VFDFMVRPFMVAGKIDNDCTGDNSGKQIGSLKPDRESGADEINVA
jgi:hypothetical protein